jgi:hypothetical protein
MTIQHEPVRGTYVRGLGGLLADPDQPPGAYDIWQRRGRGAGGIVFTCPCGCDLTSYMPFPSCVGVEPVWNGSTEEPSLTLPVENMVRTDDGHCTYHWHGELTLGVWTPS